MGLTKKVRTGVIGAGYMGALHCKAYSQNENSDFAGIFEPSDISASQAVSKYKIKRFDSIVQLLECSDAVSVAAPTTLHFEIAKECIAKGVNILMEKPIAANMDEASQILRMLEGKNLVFALGYIERFNPASIKMFELLKDKKILSFESERLAPPAPRANDVSVIFDLMIHDIDMILALLNYQRPVSIQATGRAVSGPVINDASCSLTFDRGVEAKLVSSKISDKKSRTIKVVCRDCVVEADLMSKRVVYSSGQESQTFDAEGEEPIKAEISDFILAVQNHSSPKVGAKEAYLSFETADKIEKAISKG